MSVRETAIAFPCRDNTLVGIVHAPDGEAACGVLIVVGGPQYRIGSHRQFVLLARSLAEAGIPAMRFDARGMGDSDGDFPGFETIADDIAAALDAFRHACPQIERVVLWGLCDGASAILFYAAGDPRIAGIAIANPWVRTETGLARAELKHYYAGRLASAAFWRRIARGEVALKPALASFLGTLGRLLLRRGGGTPGEAGADAGAPLPERMALGLERFGGPVLLLLSGADLTAREFEDAAGASALWGRLLADDRVTRRDLPDSDHTFSRPEDCDAVAASTRDWLQARIGA